MVSLPCKGAFSLSRGAGGLVCGAGGGNMSKNNNIMSIIKTHHGNGWEREAL